ncbi:MAG: DUF4249 family protein [Bacteroidota bacterium]
MKKLILYSIFFILLFASCEKKTEWALQTEDLKLLIVDAKITDEYKNQIIELSYSYTGLNDAPPPVTGATVSVTDGDSVYTFIEKAGSAGTYESQNAFYAQIGKTYTLLVNDGSISYTASDYMVAGESFLPLGYTLNTSDSLYYINGVTFPYTPGKAAIYEVILDWSAVAGYENADSASCTQRIMYYSLPTVDAGQVFAPRSDRIGFPAGTLVIENRYSLSPGYTEYIRALLSETTWNGGLFNTVHSNLPTNVGPKGGAGYFGVCAIKTLSFIVTP